MNIEELTLEFVSKFREEPDYIELIKLKKIIEEKYQKEITEFKDSEAKFECIKSYGKYAPDYEKYHQIFLEKKNILFAKEEVILYKRLERKINKKLESLADYIKGEIL